MPNFSTEQSLIIALTGNIGSGKTETSKIFEQLGAKVFSADNLAKKIMASHPAVKKKIQSTFGNESYANDGSLNRSYLASQVFTDPKKREALNAIVHPAVLIELQKAIQKEIQKGEYSLIIVEAALIYEIEIEELFDYVIVVAADDEEAIQRVMRRDNISREEVERRISSQMSAKAKIAKADFVIHNTESLETLKQRCSFVYTLLVNISNTA